MNFFGPPSFALVFLKVYEIERFCRINLMVRIQRDVTRGNVLILVKTFYICSISYPFILLN